MWPRKNRPSVDVSGSQQAVIRSRYVLQRVKARDPKVEQVAKEMSIIRERNHFAEQISVLMANKRKGFL